MMTGYKKAAELLVEESLRSGFDRDTLVYPIIFMYRQFIELDFHIPISKNAFEMSTEFPLFWPKIRLGDFCSCKLWK